MKIGLCMSFKNADDNYGMILQAFSTQQIVEKLGYETEIIDYKRTNWKHIRITPFLIPFFMSEFTRRKKSKGEKQNDEIHLQNIRQRNISANAFRDKNFHNIVECTGIDALEKKALSYNGVLVGSDQLWLPTVAFSNFYTLRFVPSFINKISYATSLGVSSYPWYCKSSAVNYWKRINHLSVREQQGKEIIQNLCNVPVEVVLDPTYLLTSNDWLDRIPLNNEIAEKYILCYFLGDNKFHKETARKFADLTHLKLVSILSPESYSDIDISYADEIIMGKGPDVFINLIRNAEYVFTDSFHGVAFSIINKKQFYVFYRTPVGSKESRNSRIDNILSKFGLQDRIVTEDNCTPLYDDTIIDYDSVHSILEKERIRSLKFLADSLKDCK